MATVRALQHIYSSVERGFFPREGRGFQTVALSRELIETEDRQTLERVAVYSVNSERRRAGDLPVKETFFVLPSGAYAVGRISDFGTDSMGREGNYLAHHLVVSRDDLFRAGADPFVFIDAIREQKTDLTPRELPRLNVELAFRQASLQGFHSLDAGLVANLLVAAVDSKEKTVLIVGARSRDVIESLFAALAVEERMQTTFSTHFYESDNLRPLFSIVAVESRGEAPHERRDYLLFDIEEGEHPRLAPSSAYSAWLADCAQQSRWDDALRLNAVLNELRSDAAKTKPPASEKACAALWERAGTRSARAVAGDASLIIDFLQHAPSPKPLADEILRQGSPSHVCGGADEEASKECLARLREAASSRAWKAWAEEWKTDPLVDEIKKATGSWWRVWG